MAVLSSLSPFLYYSASARHTYIHQIPIGSKHFSPFGEYRFSEG